MPLRFPDLSRKPALKTRQTTLDPTLRDEYENGMESTRPRFTRTRRQWDVTIEHLPPADVRTLDRFTEQRAVFGSVAFLFKDVRDPANPVDLNVRFSTLPAYDDEGYVEDSFRQTAKFQLREV